jgi:hypothetical protein
MTYPNLVWQVQDPTMEDMDVLTKTPQWRTWMSSIVGSWSTQALLGRPAHCQLPVTPTHFCPCQPSSPFVKPAHKLKIFHYCLQCQVSCLSPSLSLHGADQHCQDLHCLLSLPLLPPMGPNLPQQAGHWWLSALFPRNLCHRTVSPFPLEL